MHISNDLNGIHFVTDDDKNFGVAYIQVPTRNDFELARKYDGKKLDKRYIEGL